MSQEQTKTPRPQSQYGVAIKIVRGVIGTTILGFLVVSLISAYQWISSGYESSMQNLDKKISRETEVMKLRSPVLLNNSMKMILWIKGLLDRTKLNLENPTKDLNRIKPAVLNSDAKEVSNKQKKSKSEAIDVTSVGKDILNAFTKIGKILWLSFIFLLFKIIEVYAASILYLFTSLLGALDGLMKRYIRTEEGGRESTFAFHWITNITIKFPFLLIFLYFILPIEINPVVLTCLIASSFFLIFNVLTTSLKKFL